MPKDSEECQRISFCFKGIHLACVGVHEYSNEPADTKYPNVYVDWPRAAHGGSRIGIAERGRLRFAQRSGRLFRAGGSARAVGRAGDAECSERVVELSSPGFDGSASVRSGAQCFTRVVYS